MNSHIPSHNTPETSIPNAMREQVENCIAALPDTQRVEGREFLLKTIRYFWVENFPVELLLSDIRSFQTFFTPLALALRRYHASHPRAIQDFEIPNFWWFQLMEGQQKYDPQPSPRHQSRWQGLVAKLLP